MSRYQLLPVGNFWALAPFDGEFHATAQLSMATL
ncbi:MAG: hypothetical protein ACJA2J_000451 [Candidatus Azotimanducaceae bacterium]|jgi:hypothetical protein